MLSEIQIKTRQVNMPKWKTQICTSSTEMRRSDLDKMAKHLNTLARIKPSLVCLLNSFTRVSSVLEPNMAIVYSPKITWYQMERTTYIQYMYIRTCWQNKQQVESSRLQYFSWTSTRQLEKVVNCAINCTDKFQYKTRTLFHLVFLKTNILSTLRGIQW